MFKLDKVKFTLVTLMAGATAFGGSREKLKACDCDDAPSVMDALRSADAVFQGHAVEISLPRRWVSVTKTEPRDCSNLVKFVGYDAAMCREANVSVGFEVFSAWKGVTSREIAVRTPAYPESCGYRFNIGAWYLVYARFVDGQLFTDRCMRTVELPSGSKELQKLGAATLDFLAERNKEIREDPSKSKEPNRP